MYPIPYLRAPFLAAIVVLACLTLGLSTAVAADEPEGGGGENPPTTETPTDPPTESEPPPTETTPTEPETTPTEPPPTTPEAPSHPPETPGESSSPGGSSPGTPGSAPSGPSKTPARNHSSAGSPRSPQHTGGGTGKGIKVTNPLESISSGVDRIISGALAPQQIDAVGELLADSGLAPKGDKKAQHRAARKVTNALGAALLSSAVGLSPSEPPAATQPIPFVPIHGGPNYLPIVLLVLLLAGVGIVLFHQLRPVIRSRRSRPPLISSLDTGPGTGPGPGRVSLPREPARQPERPNPGRRKPAESLGGTEQL